MKWHDGSTYAIGPKSNFSYLIEKSVVFASYERQLKPQGQLVLKKDAQIIRIFVMKPLYVPQRREQGIVSDMARNDLAIFLESIGRFWWNPVCQELCQT